MGHNGILPVEIEKGDTRSDTRVFAETVMPAIGGIAALDDAEYAAKLAKWATGSKLVFMTNNPDTEHEWYIVNEQDGHWDKDMWWSNRSYVPYARTYEKLSSYGYDGYSGWGSHWTSSWYDKNGAQITTATSEQDDDYVDDAEWEKINELAYEQLAQIDIFTTVLDEDSCYVECYSCRHTEVVPADHIATHCGSCHCCLFCGHHDCDCWDELDMVMDIEDHNDKVLFATQTTVGRRGQEQFDFS